MVDGQVRFGEQTGEHSVRDIVGMVALSGDKTVETVSQDAMVMPNELENVTEEFDAEEDVERRKALPTPMLPSQAVRDHHFISHLPYRSWCGACVCGRGRERPHQRQKGKRRLQTLCVDYMCLEKDGTFTRGEWALRGDTDGVKSW